MSLFDADDYEPPVKREYSSGGGKPPRGLTAEEAAEILLPRGGWRKLDTLRRRAHEAHKLKLLTHIGVRNGAETGKPNEVYEINDLGLEAWRTLEQGKPWTIPLDPLVRSGDPETAKEGAKMKRPNTDFHRVLTLYVRHRRWNESDSK